MLSGGGVYLFVGFTKKPLYIGETSSFVSRMGPSASQAEIKVRRAVLVPTKSKEERLFWEAALTLKYLPQKNKKIDLTSYRLAKAEPGHSIFLQVEELLKDTMPHPPYLEK